MNATLHHAWRRYAAALGGYGTYGPVTKATLIVGRKAGLRYGGWREGEKIPPAAVVGVISALRARQIGPRAVGLTTVAAGGKYKGRPERTTKVELIWTGEDLVSVKKRRQESRRDFYRNVRTLAQDAAGSLGQREIIIEWNAPGRRDVTDSASPTGAPSPLSKKFCSWVRRFSRASKNPGDPCY